MKTSNTTLVSKRLLLFSALVLLATTQGCSCEDEQDLDGGDVALDAIALADTANVDDADDADDAADVARDANTTADTTSDTVSDTTSDTVSDTATDAPNDTASDAPTDTADAADTGSDTDLDTADTVSDTALDTADTTDTTDMGVDAQPDVASATGDCISGATGTHAVRFGWEGNGPNSTAYVDYEVNELPDTSRWRVGAYSSSFSYSPVYTDTFLGEGGLELSGTVFIDIELSTDGLGPLDKVTIALYGRSFNTTSPGSFTWQTFSGTGATPSGFVHNSAPYEWYRADATAALPAGDNGTLLRLRAGPPSNSLVVNRVEICFDEL
ncbi:hypothetical protein FIV42_20680 [Persicimonas caeni]|uniref:Uncharacterized protein n=1 Tax=Persicimonas caeni TaxID=2292766 RepID=A0A4Y6PXM1_PERCE|nr:hypothetical protein [Persicimonas caeni]QDG53071.1 hypothetical protein FIV42_20680 [Persicimonas caeni]QED34293.1 hypothetical protein FRD00_20675 [Persicimonas caeni]